MRDTQGYTQLGLLLTNKEDVVRDMEGKKKKKKSGSLGCSNHAVLEFKILGERGKQVVEYRP